MSSGADHAERYAESDGVFLPKPEELESIPSEGELSQMMPTAQDGIGRFRRGFKRKVAADHQRSKRAFKNTEIPTQRSRPFLQKPPKSISTGYEVDSAEPSVSDPVALTADDHVKKTRADLWHVHCGNSGETSSVSIHVDECVDECAKSTSLKCTRCGHPIESRSKEKVSRSPGYSECQRCPYSEDVALQDSVARLTEKLKALAVDDGEEVFF